MADYKSEEFRRFILENREIIEKILNEDKKEKEKASDEKVEEKLEEAKTKVKDLNDAMLKIAIDEDVQKHFITGCLEFLHFFEAVIYAAPLSPEVREVVNKFEEGRDTTIRNVVSVGAKDRMENIEINDMKKQSKSSSKASTKSKPQNIKINVKKS
jgi:hypothetical protein